ncbi:RluA family pseudouridine synthase [Luteithermobacter gelatinilyticus]|uniref:RluA family pseudouridine synthase n=1 Tax=Luteithermobacter gelatinilyticus TaxID=2582913 RepID=UPI001106D5B0|nr:RluA family pseudouridine synthase [Luteithermobacter gelatinilyticus]
MSTGSEAQQHALNPYTPPRKPYLDVLYQDDDLLVLNKPSGLLSVPGRGAHLQDCLERRAQEKFPTATTVHRLDMETSGVLVMALNRAAHRHLGLQFERRHTEKVYLARVAGLVSEDEGAIDLPLICDWPNRPRQMVDHERGRKALTHWRVLARETTATRLELRPVTGRSHQLRVHCMSLGHPILGDPFYAPPEVVRMADRLQLHAESLTLYHPTGGDRITFTSPAPF